MFVGGASRQAADCSFGDRACFDVRVELLLQPAYSTAGFYESLAVRAQALQRFSDPVPSPVTPHTDTRSLTW